MFHFFFFFDDTATPEIYTLSLHDALPILLTGAHQADAPLFLCGACSARDGSPRARSAPAETPPHRARRSRGRRSPAESRRRRSRARSLSRAPPRAPRLVAPRATPARP